MSVLPDELWRKIMEIGIETSSLDYKNLCCLSITCRRLRRLAADDSLWLPLLFSDFPSSRNDLNVSNCGNYVNSIDNCTWSSTGNGKFKSLYKIRYEKDREQKRLAHRRVVLRIESEIAERSRKIHEMELRCLEEKEKMSKTVAELLNLRKIRQASVAVKVWQPEIIRDRQRRMVQQSDVPIDSRISDLEMEVSLCKQQIAGFDKALLQEKRRLHAAREQLASVKYHPLQDSGSTSFQPTEPRIGSKKLKHTSTMQG